MIDRQSAFPPDFLILGAQKCGTSSLAAALGSHPDIFVPPFKEADHFGFVMDDEVGGKHFQKFFSGWSDQLVVGEASPKYLFSSRSAAQICRFLPGVKAIVQLRNPVDRAYSAYWHSVRHGLLDVDFGKAIDADFSLDRLDYRLPCLIARGQYAEQIECYFEHGFDRRRMLILPLDEVLADKHASLRVVQEFLEVEPVVTEFPLVNEAVTSFLPPRVRRLMHPYWRNRMVHRISSATLRPFIPPPMDPEVRARLIEHFRPWNLRLSELLGRDLPDWDR